MEAVPSKATPPIVKSFLSNLVAESALPVTEPVRLPVNLPRTSPSSKSVSIVKFLAIILDSDVISPEAVIVLIVKLPFTDSKLPVALISAFPKISPVTSKSIRVPTFVILFWFAVLIRPVRSPVISLSVGTIIPSENVLSPLIFWSVVVITPPADSTLVKLVC